MSERLAIIGTGISAMGAAYCLKDRFDITFYEKNDYPGGHTHTLTISEDGQPVYIDSGFIVYNEVTYPNLTRLFKELQISTQNTSMSFSVQHLSSGLEYSGTGLDGLFSQRRNIFNIPFIFMLLEINRFRQQAVEVLNEKDLFNLTVLEYARMRGYRDDFVYKFLLPMSSAVWSAPTERLLDFPIVTLVRFFANHCFLGLEGHLQWKTVVGGSRQYRDKLLKRVGGPVLLNRAVTSVIRQGQKVMVTDITGQENTFDKVILACHSDEALNLLKDPLPLELDLLKEFLYQPNRTTLHTDQRVMPKKRCAWSSWNYRIGPGADGKMSVTTIYHMNSLQGVSDKRHYFISVNDPGLIDPQTILWDREVHHPLYTVASLNRQARLQELNQQGPIYFCGAYFNYGFHEDGLTSGIQAATAIAKEKVW